MKMMTATRRTWGGNEKLAFSVDLVAQAICRINRIELCHPGEYPEFVMSAALDVVLDLNETLITPEEKAIIVKYKAELGNPGH